MRLGSGGGVSDWSMLIFGVDAADGEPDFEFFRGSSAPLLFNGSAEC